MVNHHKVNAEMDHVMDARAGGEGRRGAPRRSASVCLASAKDSARCGLSLSALSLLEDINMPT